MNVSESYDKLLSQGINNSGDAIKITTGLFGENDIVKVSDNPKLMYNIFFKMEKKEVVELTEKIIEEINQLQAQNDYEEMISVLNILSNNIKNYYHGERKEDRSNYYFKNGSFISDEETVCSMGQIKGAGIAECVEQAALANNILLILNDMGLFDYKPNYLNGGLSINNEKAENHAFLEFDRTNSMGEKMHIIYDITNPEEIEKNNERSYYTALYNLNDEEYKSYLEGKSFDNSKFILSNMYTPLKPRLYSKYKGIDYTDPYDNKNEELNKMVEEKAEGEEVVQKEKEK